MLPQQSKLGLPHILWDVHYTVGIPVPGHNTGQQYCVSAGNCIPDDYHYRGYSGVGTGEGGGEGDCVWNVVAMGCHPRQEVVRYEREGSEGMVVH